MKQHLDCPSPNILESIVTTCSSTSSSAKCVKFRKPAVDTFSAAPPEHNPTRPTR